MEVLDRINQQLEDFKKKRATLVAELRTEFPALLTPILSQSNKIENISWTQYTPYFNDGDECIFGVNTGDPEVNGQDMYEDANDFLRQHIGYGADKKDNPGADLHEIELMKQIKDVLKAVPEDFYKDLFGDHSKVTVYKDGRIETEEYEHD